MYKDKYQMTQEENVFYAKRNVVDSIYKMANVAGIKVTFPQTYEICEGRSVSGLLVDDMLMINNLKHAWYFIFETIDYPVNLEYIHCIYQQIEDRGTNCKFFFDKKDEDIFGDMCKQRFLDDDALKITRIMESSKTYTEKAMDMLLFLISKQLFGRKKEYIAYLIANKIMIQGGAGVISIPLSIITEFSSLLSSFYKTNNAEKVKKLIYNECIDGTTFCHYK